MNWPDDYINKVINADCLEAMKGIPDGAVDLVVTSPPYGNQRSYGSAHIEWETLMTGAFLSMWHCLSERAQVLVNLGPIHTDGEYDEYWNPWIRFMRERGWYYFGRYVWDKGDGLPGDWNGRLAPSHEYIFHFNRQRVIPNKVVPTKSRRIITGTGLRKKDDSTGKMSHEGAAVQPYKIHDDVIRVYREMSRQKVLNEHPARFPVGLPFVLIESYSQPDQIILDPFAGSGTTLVAAKQLGRKYIGIEINPNYCKIAEQRLSQEELFK